MATPKEQQPIIRSHDAKKNIIRYHLKNENHMLPAYTGLKIDGCKVAMILADGTTKWLPDLNKWYILKEANKYELVFKLKEA